jgi:hypothetical protein
VGGLNTPESVLAGLEPRRMQGWAGHPADALVNASVRSLLMGANWNRQGEIRRADITAKASMPSTKATANSDVFAVAA